jgi:YVTN family beta-propeller protein
MINKQKLQSIVLVSVTIILGLISIADAAQFTYITNLSNNNVSVIDTATKTVVSTVNGGNSSIAVGQFIGGKVLTITWSEPANIVYGTPLGSTQLNASASGPVSRSSVHGTSVYIPSLGTVLSVGTQILQACFTPNDITNYSNASASVSIDVTDGHPTHGRNFRPNHCEPSSGCYGGALIPVV